MAILIAATRNKVGSLPAKLFLSDEGAFSLTWVTPSLSAPKYTGVFPLHHYAGLLQLYVDSSLISRFHLAERKNVAAKTSTDLDSAIARSD